MGMTGRKTESCSYTDTMKPMSLPKYDTVPAAFDAVVSRWPDELAVLDGNRPWTFSELNDLANDIAGILPDEPRIGIILDHSILMIASMLAVFKAGKAYVPMEPDFPVERIRDILQEAEIRTVITQKAYTDRLLPDVKPLIPTLPMVHHALRQPAVSGEDPAYILYTSGSTGRPKGVCVLQRNLMHYVRAFHHEFHNGPGDIMLQGSVCTFDIFVEEVFTTLLNGAALAIPHTDEFHARMQYCEDHGITFISGFPWLVAQMNSEKLVPPADPHQRRGYPASLPDGHDCRQGPGVQHLWAFRNHGLCQLLLRQRKAAAGGWIPPHWPSCSGRLDGNPG